MGVPAEASVETGSRLEVNNVTITRPFGYRGKLGIDFEALRRLMSV
jgi:hypothetical protein